MIRCACEHFGAELLTEKERASIFECYLGGPSETRYRNGWVKASQGNFSSNISAISIGSNLDRSLLCFLATT